VSLYLELLLVFLVGIIWGMIPLSPSWGGISIFILGTVVGFIIKRFLV